MEKLTGIERQDAFLHGLARVIIHCYACGGSHTVHDVTVGGYDPKKSDRKQICPVSGKEIQDQMTIFGGERYFTVKKEEAPS